MASNFSVAYDRVTADKFQIDFSSMILASSSVKMEKLDIAYTLNGRLVEPALSTYSSGLICAEIMNYLFTP